MGNSPGNDGDTWWGSYTKKHLKLQNIKRHENPPCPSSGRVRQQQVADESTTNTVFSYFAWWTSRNPSYLGPRSGCPMNHHGSCWGCEWDWGGRLSAGVWGWLKRSYTQVNMGLSENRGYPQIVIWMGNMVIIHWNMRYTIFRQTHMGITVLYNFGRPVVISLVINSYRVTYKNDGGETITLGSGLVLLRVAADCLGINKNESKKALWSRINQRAQTIEHEQMFMHAWLVVWNIFSFSMTDWWFGTWLVSFYMLGMS